MACRGQVIVVTEPIGRQGGAAGVLSGEAGHQVPDLDRHGGPVVPSPEQRYAAPAGWGPTTTWPIAMTVLLDR